MIMRRLVCTLILSTAVVAAADYPRIPMQGGARNSAAATSATGDKPRQIWIKWNTATASVARARTQRLGATARFTHHGSQVIDLAPGQRMEDVLADLRQRYGNEIEFAVENIRLRPHFTPNDPGYAQQYHLPLAGFPSAWNTTRASGVTIAIADTGIMAAHGDLASRLVSGYNTYAENTTTTPPGSCTNNGEGHGTSVAGVAAAIGNNATGVTGGAFEATILPIKIVDDTDCESSTQDIDEAIRYAADRGARVVNVSFGSDIFCDADFLVSAAQYMRARGGSVVKSAGNVPVNKGCNDVSEIVVVSATDDNDQITSFSNFGNDVDMSAPGQDVLTTANGGGYAFVDGTSFSAPLTASVLALIYAIDPSFTPARAEQILFDSAHDLGAPGRDVYYGHGRVDAGRAISLAAERSIAFQRENLTNVYAYPNPWDVRRGHAPEVKFANLPDSADVRIFTVSGMWVRTVRASNGQATWDLRNDDGKNVASGLYFYVVEAAGTDNKVKGKLAVIR